jgi:hypothetical protein
MGNAVKGEVSFAQGGDTFTLVYDVDALCVAEEALDMAVEDILAQLNAKRRKMGVVRAVLWAGLRRHHPELTLLGVGQTFFGPGGLGILGAIVYIADALNKAFPKPVADGEAASGEADPPPPAADGTGSGSSVSGAN